MSLLASVKDLPDATANRGTRDWNQQLKERHPADHAELMETIDSFGRGEFDRKFPHLRSFASFLHPWLVERGCTVSMITVSKWIRSYLDDKSEK